MTTLDNLPKTISPKTYPRRVYPLDAHDLTEEQISVAVAMSYQQPQAFDEIARQVSEEKAADFNERWVLGYGHASVAEHAVIHLAMENISRLACDALEDNRLASYTEKSSRYQLMPADFFHLPQELKQDQTSASLFNGTCAQLFREYHLMLDACMEYLTGEFAQRTKERDPAYKLRLSRMATDSCRALLPAATLTNVGVTANARVLEHAISKLMSSELEEERVLGDEIRQQARVITPTLIKYAGPNDYMEAARRAQAALSGRFAQVEEPSPVISNGTVKPGAARSQVKLIHWDDQAEERLAAALLYRRSHLSYDDIWRRVLDMGTEQRSQIIAESVNGMGPHDAPVREFELVDYTFEFLMDYGAYREFKRHRMQSYIPQPLSTVHGYQVPELLVEAGLRQQFEDALEPVEKAYHEVGERFPAVAEYLVTHAHYRRLITRVNLRECYHLFKLRTSELAHFAIREPMLEAMRLAVETHPSLFRHLSLRDYPEWWPFSRD
jgi:thymidylate synthase ThyX